ncbi:hypothetical protein Hamer_G003026 [Homarus americanus]|uniref:Uncharacterized protein n=1 Tax=Homarus americanus TaxID=6706 RepID=A0A8J5JX46_HOMAM|nr:hypothetical protein Hamer_G003026 [Homarus americanus]
MNAVKHGYFKVIIRTVDTDVLVLAIAAFHLLNITELWVAFATGKCFTYLPVHEMAISLGPENCKALPFLHTFNGCDTVSSSAGWGKKTVWDVWKAFDEASLIFCALASTPSSVEDHLGILERFVVFHYDHASSAVVMNEARKQLFSPKGSCCNQLEHYKAPFR